MRKLLLPLVSFIIISCDNSTSNPEPEISLSQLLIDHQKMDLEADTLRPELGLYTLAHAVSFDFAIIEDGQLKANGTSIKPGDQIDIRGITHIEVFHKDKLVKKYPIKPSSVWKNYGLGTYQTQMKSLNKTYSYYLDQGGSGLYQYINCGPAVSTMSLLWKDSTYANTIEYARNTIRPLGGWWYTYDISMFLEERGLQTRYLSLQDPSQYENTMISMLDQGIPFILCLDMYYTEQNPSPVERTHRFYNASSPDWGHFILVKGYKIIDDQLWLECHDPYTFGRTYPDSHLMGENRYYSSKELKKATDIWWPYLIALYKNTPSARFDFVTPPPQKGRGFFK